MRANLFGYRDLHDPWLKQFRDAPQETLYAMWPGLRALMGDFTVPSFVQIRPVDLYVTKGYRQDGIVLVGDAFATSCPAAGTGARKVLVDVERLCNVHIPRWLATPGMGEAKIAAFYDDPVKLACDALSAEQGLRAALVLDRSGAALGRAALGQVRRALGQRHAAALDAAAAASSTTRRMRRRKRRRHGRAEPRRTSSARRAAYF